MAAAGREGMDAGASPSVLVRRPRPRRAGPHRGKPLQKLLIFLKAVDQAVILRQNRGRDFRSYRGRPRNQQREVGSLPWHRSSWYSDTFHFGKARNEGQHHDDGRTHTPLAPGVDHKCLQIGQIAGENHPQGATCQQGQRHDSGPTKTAEGPGNSPPSGPGTLPLRRRPRAEGRSWSRGCSEPLRSSRRHRSRTHEAQSIPQHIEGNQEAEKSQDGHDHPVQGRDKSRKDQERGPTPPVTRLFWAHNSTPISCCRYRRLESPRPLAGWSRSVVGKVPAHPPFHPHQNRGSSTQAQRLSQFPIRRNL